jgi:large subunit ribosomal protein L15
MKYNELTIDSHKDRKRVGRGISGGQGKTAGRGTKGQNSRTGKKLKVTFMGGQGTLVRRVPKQKGFKSLRVPAQVVFTDQLGGIKGATIDNHKLFEAGIIATPYHSVKLLLRGDYGGKAIVKLQFASQGARQQLEKSGSTFEKTVVPIVQSSKKLSEKSEE